MDPQRLQTQHDEDQLAQITTTPMWEPVRGDEETTPEEPHLSSWLRALRAQGEATMIDSQEEQLYSQAPDALQQAGIQPSPERIEAWVIQQLQADRNRSDPDTKAT